MKSDIRRDMIEVSLREEYKYSKFDLLNKFSCSKDKLNIILNKLMDYDIAKIVNFEKNLYASNLNNNYFKFTFVGVIIIENYVISFYPKYISNFDFTEFKSVIRVIERFQNDGEIVHLQKDINNKNSFNMLPLILFFFKDYYEYGLYNNFHEIIEINSNNEILWDKTINYNKVIIQNNVPYYYELLSKKRINDDNDYFRRLHEIIITKCSNDLKNVNLLELFGLTEVNLSDKKIEEFDNEENLLNKINQEIHSQFNTRKLELLNAMKLYILNKSSDIGLENCFSLYGTSSYYNIWEKLCCFVLNDLKDKPLTDLILPIKLNKKYEKYDDLISIIESPIWHSFNETGEFTKYAKENKLKPDLITFYHNDNTFNFLIFDAKYYNLQLEKELPLKGQPGIESITKQYLYQLTYKEFINLHGFNNVKNCFLLPTCDENIVNKGFVKLEMLNKLNLENIQVIFLPAKLVNQLFLGNEKLDICELNLM